MMWMRNTRKSPPREVVFSHGVNRFICFLAVSKMRQKIAVKLFIRRVLREGLIADIMEEVY